MSPQGGGWVLPGATAPGATAAEPATARPALETLQPHLQAAFDADDITMDVFSLTSETMNRNWGHRSPASTTAGSGRGASRCA